MNEAQASEYVEQHEVMLVMAAGKEAVPAVATVTWKSSSFGLPLDEEMIFL